MKFIAVLLGATIYSASAAHLRRPKDDETSINDIRWS